MIACVLLLVLLPAPIFGLLSGIWLTEFRRALLAGGPACPGCGYDRAGRADDEVCTECGLTKGEALAHQERRHVLPAVVWLPLALAAAVTADLLIPPHGSFATACILCALLAGPIAVAIMVAVPRFGRDARTPWLLSLLCGGFTVLVSGWWLRTLFTRTSWGEYGREFDLQVGGIGVMLLSLGGAGYIAVAVLAGIWVAERIRAEAARSEPRARR